MATANRRRTTTAPKQDQTPDLDVARRLIAEAEAERAQRVDAFLVEFEELCAKHRVTIQAQPVQVQVVALD